MRRYLRDPAILFSIILVLLVFILSIYPITLFYFKKYLPMPKTFSEQSWILYYGEEDIVANGNPQLVFYELNVSRGKDGYIISLVIRNGTVMKNSLYGYLAFPPGGMASIDFSRFVPLCRASLILNNRDDSAILRLIIVPWQRNNTTLTLIRGYALVVSGTSTRYVHATFSAYDPDKVLGYARIYRASILINGTVCKPYFECPVLYLRTDKMLFLGSIVIRYSHLDIESNTSYVAKPLLALVLLSDFKRNCPFLNKLVRLVEEGNASVSGEYLFLKSLSFIPRDQAWLDAFIARFNGLFPFSYMLLGLAVLIAIARIRKWL